MAVEDRAETSVFKRRICALRRTKSEHTEEKIRRRGFFDIDDHGYIPWDAPIAFKKRSNHPSGGCYGARCIGENFRRWLQVHPVYIHPQSALAGAWVQHGPPGVGGWRPEDKAHHLRALHQKYNIIYSGIGGMNHFGPDLRLGLDLGWGGLLRKIRRYRALNRPADTSFYDGEEALVLGVQEWIQRHVDHARKQAEATADGQLRENYLQIADMNAWLIDQPPRTLREACQFLAWFQSIDRMWAAGGALGQLDELLRPFYEQDLAAGVLNGDDEAIWCIASLFFNDTHYSQIGGPDAATGRDLSSRVSFLILDAMHLLRIPINIAVRLHDDLDPELLRRSVEYLFADGTGCSYACATGLDRGYARNGVPLQIARMRAKVGCNWTALPGIEYCLQDVTRMCLVSPFEHAFRELMATDPEPSLEALWALYHHHLSISVDTIKRGFDWHLAHHSRNAPEIVLNLFMHGTLERGLDVAAGGVDIYRLTCDGVGLATVADSFAAIEQRVVQEGRLSWQELARHLENDFADAEPVRLMLKSIPRFGAGDSRGDAWARRVAQAYTDLMRNTPTPHGFTVIPGLFSRSVETPGKPARNQPGSPVAPRPNPGRWLLP